MERRPRPRLLTWILMRGGLEPSYMIGGIPRNLGQGAHFNDSKYFVIEGDEYDTAFFDKRSKFIHYLPELVIVNNIEFDHADIFDNLEMVKRSFRHLLRIVPQNGMVLINGDDPNCVEVTTVATPNGRSRVLGELRASDSRCRLLGRIIAFRLHDDSFELPMIGEFNVRNAAMAISAARFTACRKREIREGAQQFQRHRAPAGSARRDRGGVKVIDDFGHHPTAIAQTLTALRHRYPGQRIWAVFEPRSNTTRRAVFQQELPDALKLADGVFISQVARLDQIPANERLNPEAVVKSIADSGRPAFYEPDADHIVDRYSREAARAVEGVIRPRQPDPRLCLAL
jgi:UDP-N-acetylmuramate: L-alanyl-gamma-D-glutamyl-meso-diaminopimelate ligase